MEDGKSQASTPHQLEEWSDEQLRQLLLAQMEAEEVDVELVRSITAILASRGEEKGHEIDALSARVAVPPGTMVVLVLPFTRPTLFAQRMLVSAHSEMLPTSVKPAKALCAETSSP